MTAAPQEDDRYRQIVELSPDSILIGREGLIVYANPAVLRLVGATSLDQVIGRSPFDLLHPDSRPNVARRIEQLRSGQTLSMTEERLVRLDGTLLDVDITGSLFDDHRGSGLQVIVRDITERKRAEATLRADEHRLRAFLENSAVAGWLKDEDGRYVFLSKNFQRFGMSIEEWVGKSDFDFWPREAAEAFRRNDLVVLSSGKSIEVVEEAIYPDGTRLWWLNHKFRLEGGDGRHYVGGLGVDVTERTNAEELLRQAHDELEARVRERTAELASTNVALQLEIAERERAEIARRELLARLVFAQEDERRRIAREMHDQLGEQLTSLGLHVRGLQEAVAWTSPCAA